MEMLVQGILGVLAFIFCMFLFMAVLWAIAATFELAASLFMLPGTLVSLLTGYLLLKKTRLTGGVIMVVHVTAVAFIFAASGAIVAFACGVPAMTLLAATAGGAFYGSFCGLFEALETRLWEQRVI